MGPSLPRRISTICAISILKNDGTIFLLQIHTHTYIYIYIYSITKVPFLPDAIALNSLDRVTHICVDELTITGWDNGMSPGRHQAIIWTNTGISLIGPLGTNFSEILIGIQVFSFKKMHLSSAKGYPFCLGLNVLTSLLSVVHVTRIWIRPLWTPWRDCNTNNIFSWNRIRF